MQLHALLIVVAGERAEDFASPQERADGIKGCEIVIHCGCIVLLYRRWLV